jgi:hypothetical protein
METVVQYNQLSDVSDEDRAVVEAASGQALEQLDINDVNSFLNELIIFYRMLEEDYWNNLS